MVLNIFKRIVAFITLCILMVVEGGGNVSCQTLTSDTSARFTIQQLPDSSALTVQKKSIIHTDSVLRMLVADTLHADSLHTRDSVIHSDSLPIHQEKSQALSAPVIYKASDSIVFTAKGKGYLYGQGEVTHQDKQPMQITADYIEFDSKTGIIHATGRTDSLGTMTGKPVFNDGHSDYSANEMDYNFNTQRGYIKGGVTQQGEGYIVAEKTKKTADGMMFMEKGVYTTCSYTDHPHFYLRLTRAKVRPNGYIAAGPAYMVLEDVPLPLAVPFAFFPFTSTYSSGVIMPSFGDEMERGLFLRDGGYYFAINDYVDATVMGEIFTKGTWGITGTSNYRWRYHFSGNFNISYREDVAGDKNLLNYSKSKNLKVTWRHTQDPKMSQFSTFSASVDFTTSGYNRSNVNYYYNPIEQSKNITSSSINYSQRFPESPISLALNASFSQRTADSTISLNLPSLTMNVSRLYPFKRKNRVGKERFYEKIAFSYTMVFSNSISTKESMLLHASFARDWNSKITHKPVIQASYTLFKYLNITPSINYSSTMSFRKVEQDWNVQRQEVVRDTSTGFFYTHNFSGGISLSTKLYGFYIPSRKLFGDGLDRIRHVFIPSISFNYSPDFGKSMWGMYKSYDRMVVDKNNVNRFTHEQVLYSPYIDAPGRGEHSTLSFMFDNNLEMKVKDRAKTDTTGATSYKKISLIDKLAISGGYNFAADSMKWSNFNMQLRLKFSDKFSLNLSGSFDPYMYALNSNGIPVRVNRLRWNHGRAPYFMGTSTNFQYTFNNETFKRKKKSKPQEQVDATEDNPLHDEEGMDDNLNGANMGNHDENKQLDVDAEGYAKPNFQWSLSVSYSIAIVTKTGLDNFDYKRMQYRRGINHTLTLNGYINPTPKWKLNYNASFDLTAKKFTNLTMTIQRDLHCWYMNASVTPISYAPYGTSFMVTIGANASILRDLKYDKRSDASSNVRWF